MKLMIRKNDFQCHMYYKPSTNEGRGATKGKTSVHVPLRNCVEWLQKKWTQKNEARKAECNIGEWCAMMAQIPRATR
jgi:hypothetical protein